MDIPKNKAIASSLSSFGLRVNTAIKKREEAFKDLGISLEDRTYGVLEIREQRSFRNSLKEKYGAEAILNQGEKLEGIVKKRKVLGSGLQEVIQTGSGFVLRKLGSKDSHIPIGSKVLIQKAGAGIRLQVVNAKGRANRGRGKGSK